MYPLFFLSKSGKSSPQVAVSQSRQHLVIWDRIATKWGIEDPLAMKRIVKKRKSIPQKR